MKKITLLFMMSSLMLSGCIVLPEPHIPKIVIGGGGGGGHCPPGQAKKGNC